jgi:hypothetical protein
MAENRALEILINGKPPNKAKKNTFTDIEILNNSE